MSQPSALPTRWFPTVAAVVSGVLLVLAGWATWWWTHPHALSDTGPSSTFYTRPGGPAVAINLFVSREGGRDNPLRLTSARLRTTSDTSGSRWRIAVCTIDGTEGRIGTVQEGETGRDCTRVRWVGERGPAATLTADDDVLLVASTTRAGRTG